ncbi:MAG: N-acetyltransferase [Geminicoccaceae bacterium]
MSSGLTIRPERPADIAAIARITEAAFTGHPYSRGTEALIVDGLRRDGALSLSLVAVLGDEVVGHVAFSPAGIADGSQGWQALGPVSVAPASQRRGIGSALVRAGLDEIRKRGAAGCVLVGEPAFYERFGFRSDPSLTMDGVPQEYVLALRLTDDGAAGAITHHPAFHVEA